ncbi:3-hydroxyacyl-CoA dehydrogenase family protein [Kyrpidia tusciae]|uniref:3-hydroxyacyl-CoA dehydrogenase n=1 Tax=Kyrpidia tusciae (strain DSM 2912 / NBRC 15312 / T2) TaxID=562970 RepID=D5WTI2_KYRT2|nr:3-hydroxyacyl-CoA dehydrogenase family protein [Kyrpidia tusciae]ADG07218.1 3-hydroxyacyl-CoA dehydrogenase [Kyrpidia tusciae DSM 2912]
MSIDAVKRIGVVGSGAMGTQIAAVCALAGYPVKVQDIATESLERARQVLTEQLEKRVQKGKLSREQVDGAWSRLSWTTDLGEAVRDADYVIEAIVEKLDAKRELFARLDELAPAHAILATNSSTIVSSKIADATRRPENVCNMHFFNPVLVMELVEVVMNPQTSEDTADTAVELCRRIGKTPILLKKEISGFVANRLLMALFKEAMYLYEQGIADFKDIDLAATKALNHPMGPFTLMDFTGLDVNYYVMQQQYAETGDPAMKPPEILREKFERGEFGRKSGKGFYTYE